MTNQQITKNAIYQKLPLSGGSSFVVNRFTSPQFETPWHFHEAYELVYCEKSFGNKFIGNSFSAYHEGDMAFIGKNVPHLFKADESFYGEVVTAKPSSLVIQFVDDFLGTSFFNTPEMVEMKQVMALSKNGLSVLGDTKQKIKTVMLRMLAGDKAQKLSGLIEIFGLLATSNELQPILLDNVSGINANDSLKMNRILEYALNNYKEDISVNEIAKLTHLSASAFCRYFRSRTQKSFLTFIIEMRLNEACQLLKKTEMPIIDVCYEAGFKNLSNFNRLFRKHFHKNPAAYRKANV